MSQKDRIKVTFALANNKYPTNPSLVECMKLKQNFNLGIGLQNTNENLREWEREKQNEKNRDGMVLLKGRLHIQPTELLRFPSAHLILFTNRLFSFSSASIEFCDLFLCRWYTYVRTRKKNTRGNFQFAASTKCNYVTYASYVIWFMSLNVIKCWMRSNREALHQGWYWQIFFLSLLCFRYRTMESPRDRIQF